MLVLPGIAILLTQALPGPAACALDPELTAAVNRGIEYCILQDFDSALEIMDSLVAAEPERPETWFYRATVHAYRMTDEESFRWEEEFLGDLDSSGARLECWEDRAGRGELPPELQFIQGSIHSWKAYHLGRRERWLAAIRSGWAGIRVLEDLFDRCPDFADLKLGIGNFRYWKSAKMEHFIWLPFVRDERAEGIRLVEEARREGVFSPWVGASNLSWMYLDLGEAERAAALCREALDVFPGSRLFLFPLAEALLEKGDSAAADSCFRLILDSLSGEAYNNHVNEFICLEKLSRAAEEQGRFEDVLDLGRQALELPLSSENRSRLHEREQRLLKRMAQTERLSDRGTGDSSLSP